MREGTQCVLFLAVATLAPGRRHGQGDLIARLTDDHADLIVVDGVALATENFNSGPPFITDPTLAARRTPFFNDNGSAFYHGWTFGTEWLW